MKFEDYLISLLGEKRASDLQEALREGKTIIVCGPQGPTGKSALVQVLRSKGYCAMESFDVCEVRLDKELPKMIPNFKDDVIG